MNATSFDTHRLARRIGGPGMDWAVTTRPDTSIVELSNTFVRVRVSGPPNGDRTIVFAADAPMVIEQYDAIFAELSSVGRVACFEEPGFGFSFPRDGFGFTRGEYASVLIELLERLGRGPHILAFPCWTAYQALEVAQRRPDLVEALVLMQAPSWDEEVVWTRGVARAFGLATLGVPFLGDRLFGAPFLGQALCALIERRFVDRTTRFVVHNGFHRRELVARFRAAGNDAFRRGACNCQASVFQAYFAGAAEIGTLAQPAMLLWGANDRSHRNSDRAGLRKHLPTAEVRVVGDTGHHLEHENPAGVCGEIRRFIATLPSRGCES